MKVTTRLSLSLGFLVAIALFVLVVHVRTLRTVVSTSYALSDMSARVTLSSRTQMTRLAQMEESASKYLVTHDRGYVDRMQELQRDFATDVARLSRLPLRAAERREADELVRRWEAYRVSAAAFAAGGAPEVERLSALRADLTALQAQARRMGEVSQEAMDEALASSAAIARRAEWITWSAAGAGLLLSIGLSALLVRSISGALRRLREGTRQVAGGNFAYRIAVDGNDEFADLAHEFNGMSRQLGELDRMKREFVSHVSHDLKTPLASMLEITRALLDRLPGPLTVEQTRLLELHLQSGQRLSTMISNLLDLSALEAGTRVLQRDRHDLATLVQLALEAVEPARAMRELDLAVRLPEPPLAVECDGQRMQQLLVNVLDNAIKFTPAGGRVEVRADPHRERPTGVPEARWRAVHGTQEGDTLLITVSDSGPGIPAGDRERVFERFVQSEQGRRERARGVGLGLAICREIVEAHGWSMWADQGEGGGCAMHLLLPGAGASSATQSSAGRVLARS